VPLIRSEVNRSRARKEAGSSRTSRRASTPPKIMEPNTDSPGIGFFWHGYSAGRRLKLVPARRVAWRTARRARRTASRGALECHPARL
jgi:hypothetical protein